MQKIYFDYAATTPLDKEVLKAMLPYLKNDFGNPSSLHQFGQKTRRAIDKARQNTADFLNCSPLEIVFTGSATEANNTAILGVAKAAQKKGVKPHIITANIEHPAVLEPCRVLEKQGIEITYLPVSKNGLIEPEQVEKSIRQNTVLVSIMYANNEIGTIQPIAQIAKIICNFRNSKKQETTTEQNTNSKFQYPIFHTDAVQAANYLDCDVQKLAVDLLTLSGHKIYGPKGVGALYARMGTAIEPIIFGGHQENSLRPGTENVAAIVGFGAAIAAISNFKMQISNLKKLRDKLLDGTLKTIPKTYLNGSRENRLPNNVNISFSGVEGESIVIALDQQGIAASTGSACSSASLEPSHVILSLGHSPIVAHGSLRLTLGKYTTEKEIDALLNVLPKIVKRLRAISPFK